MPEVITKLQQQFSDFWKDLEKSQKSRIYITTIIIAVVIAAGLFYITRTNYVTIVSGAERSDIKEMLTILDENAIKAKVSDDGNTISVDSKDRNKAEFALAKEGYPKGGMTFEEAWSMIKLSTTESDKKMLRNEYKKRNLVSQLKMFDNIKDASVEIAVPEPSLFEKEKRPTAYVRITPKGTITPEQIQGIVLVVSKSVENLDPKDITIVDNYANNLSSKVTDSSYSSASSQEELRLKRAEELKNKVYNLYGGPSEFYDTVKVEASVVLDFNKEATIIKDIQPGTGLDGGALISMERTKENLQNGSAGSIPGTDTNPGSIPSYQIGTDSKATYDKENIKQNYEYKTVETSTEKAIGTLDPEKSSIAATLWYGRKVKDDSKLTTEFINELKNNISNATGIPASKVSVIKCELPPEDTAMVSYPEQVRELVDAYGFYVLMLLLIVGLMILAVPKRKRQLQLAPAEAAAAFAAQSINKASDSDIFKKIPLDEKSELKLQLEKFAKEKPEAVAQLLKNWLSEDW